MKNELHRNKLIAFCMIAILALGQFALSNHSAVHYDHILHENGAHAGDAPNHDDKNIRHNCPECLLTHAYNVADIPTSYYQPEIHYAKHPLTTESLEIQGLVFYSYDATGPPAISI